MKQEGSTYCNQIATSFLHLPAELRNKIYAHTLGSYDILIENYSFRNYHGLKFSVRPQISRRPRHWMWTGPKLHIAALHYTCRQIRHETSHLIFALNTFQGSPQVMYRFLKHQSTKADHIKAVRIVIVENFDLDQTPESLLELENLYHTLRRLRHLTALERISICSGGKTWRYTDESVVASARSAFDDNREGRQQVDIMVEVGGRLCHIGTN